MTIVSFTSGRVLTASRALVLLGKAPGEDRVYVQVGGARSWFPTSEVSEVRVLPDGEDT